MFYPIFLMLLMLLTPQVFAEGGLTADLQKIGVSDTVGKKLDLNLEFVNEEGASIKLASLLKGEGPLVVSVVYYGCPNLCTLVLNNLVRGLNDLPDVGDAEIVAVSVDPSEDWVLAAKKKSAYLENLKNKNANWSFLTGKAKSIQALTSELGFTYSRDEQSGEFLHAAALYFLNSEGEIKRILFGSTYDANSIRLALMEAKKNKTWLEKLTLLFYRYDTVERHYSFGLR